MRFKQIGELVLGLSDARQALAKLYARLAAQVDSSRSRMVLEYLAGREHGGHQQLLDYLQQAPRGVLDTWFQNAFDSDFIARLNRIDLDAGASPNDVLQLALGLDQQLIELLAQQAEQAPTPEARAALLSMMADEQQQQRKMVLNIARFEDV